MGVGERDAGTESDSSTGDVYPPSERRQRTTSGGRGAGGEGFATVVRGGVNGGESSWSWTHVTDGSGSEGANNRILAIADCAS